ncbi:MAG TPA: amidohydrolase family protein [Candidatus Acidoferrales bacterium]|nr:amidohydrolase family protein [Candidatus Acidoferrales bacterium]
MRHKFVIFRRFIMSALLLMLMVSVAAIFGGAAFAQAPAQVAPKPPVITTTYIRAGKLLDVHSGRVLSDMVIVVHGQEIDRVTRAAEISIPAGANVIDLSNAFVLPGLIDAHEHIFLTGEDHGRYDEQLLKESYQYRTIEAIKNAWRDLDAGFTSMRDCETEGAMFSDVDVREAIDRGIIAGPRLWVATRAMSVTGSYPLLGYSPEVTVPTGVQIVDGPDEARKAVREQIKYGADFIKVYGTGSSRFAEHGKMVSTPTFTLDELKAIVEEAHRWGRKVACHAYGDPGLRNCVDAGVDSIEHGLDLSDYDIREMKTKGIWLVPTLYVYVLSEPEDLRESDGMASRASIHEVSFKKALAAGIKIAFGTDAGPFPHGTQAKEFEYMVQYGMTPLEAIQAATLNAARVMDPYHPMSLSAAESTGEEPRNSGYANPVFETRYWSKSVGAIDPGKFADIIAVAGNPLDDIKQLERVKFVMKGGEVYKNDFVTLPVDKLQQ